jgi:hypothetical protein
LISSPTDSSFSFFTATHTFTSTSACLPVCFFRFTGAGDQIFFNNNILSILYVYIILFDIKMLLSTLIASLNVACTYVSAAPQALGLVGGLTPAIPHPGPGITAPFPVLDGNPLLRPEVSSASSSAAPSAAIPASVPAVPAVPSPATSPTAPNTANPDNANSGQENPAAQIQACAADVDRLASGIQQNIVDQQGEQVIAQGLLLFLQAGNATRNDTGTISGLLAKVPNGNDTANGVNGTACGNATAPAPKPDRNLALFVALKGQLLSFVNAGVAIRKGNQAIAPPASAAVQGLAQVWTSHTLHLSFYHLFHLFSMPHCGLFPLVQFVSTRFIVSFFSYSLADFFQ